MERHDGGRPGRGGGGHRERPLGRPSGRGRRVPLRRAAPRHDGRWLRSWQAGRARHLALAADYAWVVECSTRLAELTGQARWTDRAGHRRPAAGAFWDGPSPGPRDRRPGGGLFTTGDDAEALFVRPKDLVDGAVPSANSVAAAALLRLGRPDRRDRYRRPASAPGRRRRTVASADHPMAVADLVPAVGLLEEGGRGGRRRRPAGPAGRGPAALATGGRRGLGRAGTGSPAVGRTGPTVWPMSAGRYTCQAPAE